MPNLESKPDPFKRGAYQLSERALNQIRDIGLRQIRGGDNTNVSQFGDRVFVQSRDHTALLPGLENYLLPLVVHKEYPDYLACTTFYQPVEDNLITPQLYNKNLSTQTTVDGQVINTTVGGGAIVPDLMVYVAKPYLLQQTPWHEKIVEERDVLGQKSSFTYYSIEESQNGSEQKPWTPTSTNPRMSGVRGFVPAGSSVFGWDWDGGYQHIFPNYMPGDIIYAINGMTGYNFPEAPNRVPLVWVDANVGGRRWEQSTVDLTCDARAADIPGDYIHEFDLLYLPRVAIYWPDLYHTQDYFGEARLQRYWPNPSMGGGTQPWADGVAINYGRNLLINIPGGARVNGVWKKLIPTLDHRNHLRARYPERVQESSSWPEYLEVYERVRGAGLAKDLGSVHVNGGMAGEGTVWSVDWGAFGGNGVRLRLNYDAFEYVPIAGPQLIAEIKGKASDLVSTVASFTENVGRYFFGVVYKYSHSRGSVMYLGPVLIFDLSRPDGALTPTPPDDFAFQNKFPALYVGDHKNGYPIFQVHTGLSQVYVPR